MHRQRLAELRKELAAHRLDALLVTSLPHIRYLTGFTGSHGVCLITRSRQFFAADGRYRDQSREEVRGFRILIANENLFLTLARAAKLRRAARLGFESNHLSVSAFRNLKRAFPTKRPVPIQGMVERIASVKDDSEIDYIRRAVRITDRVFSSILDLIKPGVREHELAAEIIYRHRTLGAEAEAFEPIVASGTRGAFPHARATSKRIRKGELVTLDLGCRVHGYHSDLTRTVAVGSVSRRLREVYRTVLEAQHRAIEAAREGIRASELDRVARTHIRKCGYGRYFPHSLGHGLGLQVHESPRLAEVSKDVLRSGNVVTIEPGIYIPGTGGVRIEDDVVIRHRGCEVLNRATKELIVL